jgi:hypothetical protein
MIALRLKSLTTEAKRWACSVLAVLLATAIGAAVGASVNAALTEKHRADQAIKAPQICAPVAQVVTATTKAANAAITAQQKVSDVRTRVSTELQRAAAAVPTSAQGCPTAQDPDLGAWRSGIDGLRRAARTSGADAAGDDPAGTDDEVQ